MQIEPPRPGYLDLNLDEKRGELSREGYSDHAQLRPLTISMLKLFLRNRETLTSREMLMRIWDAPEGAGPSVGVMDNEISELRQILNPFGVVIRNRPKLGWWLQDKDSADKEAAKTKTRNAKRRANGNRRRKANRKTLPVQAKPVAPASQDH